MYFVIIGSQRELVREELKAYLGKPDQLIGQAALYESDKSWEEFSARVARLSGAVKRGRAYQIEEVGALLEDVSLLGTNNDQLAYTAKKEHGVRRYKLIDLLHTDREIQKKGTEILTIGDKRVGHVLERQDIKRFEVIDFKKPARGMQIGMMPAKLTQLLINIGTAELESGQEVTIYDPFCGFGTTLFVANSLGYNTIGSDINITPTKQNIKWREGTPYATDKKLFIFKHDATSRFTKPVLQHVDLIVSEGWLGPVVSKRTHFKHLKENLEEIFDLYAQFFTAVRESDLSVPIVITIPSYSELTTPPFSDFLAQLAASAEGECTHIGSYQRRGQTITRNIVLFHPK